MGSGSDSEGGEEAKLDAELVSLFHHWIVYSEWFPDEDETEHLKITDEIEDFCELIHRRLAELVIDIEDGTTGAVSPEPPRKDKGEKEDTMEC